MDSGQGYGQKLRSQSYILVDVSGLVGGALLLEPPVTSARLEIDPLLEEPFVSTNLTFLTNLVRTGGFSPDLSELACAVKLMSGCTEQEELRREQCDVTVTARQLCVGKEGS